MKLTRRTHARRGWKKKSHAILIEGHTSALCSLSIPQRYRRAFEPLGCKHYFGVGQYCSTSMIKVVEMMIVAQKHIVKKAKRFEA
jgi:hypothetical protein